MSDLWFHRGKEARANGRPRELKDARVSRPNRALFFDGWDEQERLTARPTAAQRRETAIVFRKLKEFATTL